MQPVTCDGTYKACLACVMCVMTCCALPNSCDAGVGYRQAGNAACLCFVAAGGLDSMSSGDAGDIAAMSPCSDLRTLARLPCCPKHSSASGDVASVACCSHRPLDPIAHRALLLDRARPCSVPCRPGMCSPAAVPCSTTLLPKRASSEAVTCTEWLPSRIMPGRPLLGSDVHEAAPSVLLAAGAASGAAAAASASAIRARSPGVPAPASSAPPPRTCPSMRGSPAAGGLRTPGVGAVADGPMSAGTASAKPNTGGTKRPGDTWRPAGGCAPAHA
eukprot:130806-Chlamydomonas_euryale.AAC.2